MTKPVSRCSDAIVIRTGVMEGDIASSKAAGFSEHLTKPVDWERLKEAIERVADCGGQCSEMDGDAA